jgi:DNA transposition AAA+ family ATPase
VAVPIEPQQEISMTDTLQKVLMDRDGMSAEDANALIQEAKDDLMERLDEGVYVDQDDFMSDWFGLESDYILEII